MLRILKICWLSADSGYHWCQSIHAMIYILYLIHEINSFFLNYILVSFYIECGCRRQFFPRWMRQLSFPQTLVIIKTSRESIGTILFPILSGQPRMKSRWSHSGRSETSGIRLGIRAVRNSATLCKSTTSVSTISVTRTKMLTPSALSCHIHN